MTNKSDLVNSFIYSDFMDEVIQYRLKILIDDTVMNSFIYSDFMDEVIQYRLKILIDDTVESIREYKAKDNLKPHQQVDLDKWLKDIKYLTDTYIFFSGQYNYRPEFYDE